MHRLKLLDHSPQMQEWVRRFERDKERFFSAVESIQSRLKLLSSALVAVIYQSTSLRNILYYNEQKVKAGLAVCLEAGYYPAEAADWNFHQKLRRLEILTELNQRTSLTVYIFR